jgi:hypothetical protein
MALTSPGVQVSVIDESFYTPAEPGTVPMVFVASASNKTNAAGTGTAQGTLKANAGKPYLLTSQRDLADTFGDPTFQIDSNNNPIHGSELNEYGLQAAYSLLGVSNRAWVVRADMDLGELTPTATAPTANPTAGTYWFDTASTEFGIQVWNAANVNTTGGQSFSNITPIVITDSAQTSGSAPYTPKTSVGAVGDYAVVAVSTINRLWYKNSGGAWVEVGSDNWTKSHATITGTKANPVGTVGSAGNLEINGSVVAVTNGMTLSQIATAINDALISGVTAAGVNSYLEIYSDGSSSGAGDSSTGGQILLGGDAGTLELVGMTAGTYYPPAVQISKHTSIPTWKITDTSLGQPTGISARPSGSIWFKTTEPNKGANISAKLWNSATLLWDTIPVPLYDTSADAIYGLDPTGGGANLGIGNLYAKTNVAGDVQPLVNFTLFRRQNAGATTVTSNAVTASAPGAGTFTFLVSSTDDGSASYSTPYMVTVVTNGNTDDASVIAGAINSAGVQNVSASVDASNRVVISHSQGGEIKFTDTDSMLAAIGFNPVGEGVESSWTSNYYLQDGTVIGDKMFIASNWKTLTYTASNNAVTSLATDGQLWYNSVVDEIDIMIHNGTDWVGYQNEYGDADSLGPIVSASQPTKQTDGSSLVTGDIWIDTSDLENYPQIYIFNDTISGNINKKWGSPLDKSDQTSENGILFADARYGTSGGTATTAPSGTIPELLVSNYLDPDAPNPSLYPKGMLLWNTRRSGFNVKRFERNYIDTTTTNARFTVDGNGDFDANGDAEAMDNYYPHRWVTESGNQADGSGSFGRKAQRKVVVQALQAVVNNNDEIRDDESRLFNVMATPGYPELIGEMISLNNDRGLTAFVVGDSPLRLTPDATSLNDWATNVNAAVEDNDNGLVSRDEYLGVFYPSGFSSDNFGNNIVVPASHMMLRTIAISDQVSFPWFAPAGTRRGGITNASSTGYINSEGEFVSVALNEGQRDTLYSNAVNPITFISGAGLVAFGQKTRARGASSLDRINVARLVIYLRSQLNTLAKPYIFEPNDKITRDEIKQAAESLLLELVGQRALYDYLVVCDESNNTPSRIDRNELYLDIAIEPVKAVEFIYIPLRLKNTGEIAGL